MTNTETSESQARAQLESIVAMVKRLEHAESCEVMDDLAENECELSDGDMMAALGYYGDRYDRESLLREYHDADAAREAIEQDALSVEVRSGWYPAGYDGGTYRVEDGRMSNLRAAAEYKILLCWGGPAVRIVGGLDENGEPETARLEHQDWGTEWTEYRIYATEKDQIDESVTDRKAIAASEKELFKAFETRLAIADESRDALLTYARQFYYGS